MESLSPDSVSPWVTSHALIPSFQMSKTSTFYCTLIARNFEPTRAVTTLTLRKIQALMSLPDYRRHMGYFFVNQFTEKILK